MGRECKEPDPGSDRSSARRRGLFPLGMGFAGHRRDLYQRAYALTVAQWRCVIVLIRSGSSIRNRHAFEHAATIAS
jgi:hypothetical protein